MIYDRFINEYINKNNKIYSSYMQFDNKSNSKIYVIYKKDIDMNIIYDTIIHVCKNNLDLNI